MKKVLGALLFTLCTAISTANAAGNTKLYYGVGFTDGSVNVANGEDKSLGTISGVVGFQLIDFLSVEFSLGAGSDQTGSILSEPLVSYQAVLLRLGYRWDHAGIYLLGGQARLDINSRFNNSDAGNAVGFGINLFGNETTSLNFNVLDIDDGAFTTATIGFQYYFGGFR